MSNLDALRTNLTEIMQAQDDANNAMWQILGVNPAYGFTLEITTKLGQDLADEIQARQEYVLFNEIFGIYPNGYTLRDIILAKRDAALKRFTGERDYGIGTLLGAWIAAIIAIQNAKIHKKNKKKGADNPFLERTAD